MLEVKELTGGNPMLTKLNFKLANGGTYGVYARTRKEQTALLALLAGDTAPDEGQVLIGGFDLGTEASNAKKSIGYLPYDDPTPDELSPVEYLLLIAQIKGMSRERAIRRVQELLCATGLDAWRDAPMSSLSAYERRTTALLQTLLTNPEFLLLDDPTAGLSYEDGARILRHVKELGGEHTVLISLRRLCDLSRLCDEILVIENGGFVGAFETNSPALKEYENKFKYATGGNA